MSKVKVESKYTQGFYKGYMIDIRLMAGNQAEARRLVRRLEEEFPYLRVTPLAGDKCPAGHDHAHARYDGATWCDGCEAELSAPRHSQGGFRR